MSLSVVCDVEACVADELRTCQENQTGGNFVTGSFVSLAWQQLDQKCFIHDGDDDDNMDGKKVHLMKLFLKHVLVVVSCDNYVLEDCW